MPARRKENHNGFKFCPCCGETKPLSEFHKNKARKVGGDGVSTYCKKCQNKYTNKNAKKRLKEKYIPMAKKYFGTHCAICGAEVFKKPHDYQIHHLTSDNDYIKGQHVIRRPNDWHNCILCCHHCHVALHAIHRSVIGGQWNLTKILEHLKGYLERGGV